MSELVTGEAVALELRPAKLPSRVLAVVLDLAVAVAAYVAVTIALVASTAALDEAAQMAVSIAAFILLLVGGPIAVETLSHGRSLGKLACGLRVVRDDGGPIRFRHALVRGAVGVIEILMTFGVVACIASLVSARGRRLGDVFAGTLVVRERIPAGRTAFVPPPPPWLAGRFSGLDLSGVPDALWLAVRQYLTRMQQLDPQVGWAMAERLAADVAERTGAPAPQGVPPAAYLAAVVQERQAREARRAFSGGAAGPAAGGQMAGAPGTPSTPGTSRPVTPYGTVPSPESAYSAYPSYPAPPASPSSAHSAPAPAPAPAPTPQDAGAERPATGFAPPA
ncbi:putative RDD family membrane protein YckC [Streptomyces umbrinus]|uniref:RDD family membrane protein YckC n=1 Tax=Streptomyces umbrinus TaxID=67370 RepID=A0ABU0SZ15_9ACTN|nr:RDD family protein [Streptomyces umbrinus]MDQ1028800.1 putative RDD family membrane protein YckC [Streptomyces umbrinus]